MATLTLQPTGGTALSLLGPDVTLQYEGSVESILPVPTYDEEYAESSESEGGYRVRSRPQNPEASGRVMVTGTSLADLRANVSTWEQTVEDTRRYGGELAYTPTSGSAITYDIVSMRVTTMPQDAVMEANFYQESEFEFTCRPYGRLEGTAVVSNATGSGVVSFDVPELTGSVDALGILTITDTASQARQHFYGGMESEYYDSAAPWPVFVDSSSMTLGSGAAGTALATAYGGTAIHHATITTATPLASYTSSHVGRFRVKARVYSDQAGGWYRASWSVRGGGQTYLNWVALPAATAWYELDLGVVTISPASTGSHSVTFYVSSKSGTSADMMIDYLKLVPAERFWQAHGSVGAVATIRSGRYLQVRHDGLLTETATDIWAQHPAAVGSYLRIPRRGGRICVSADRADLDGTVSVLASLSDSLRCDLTVIPRVALLGA